jgi:hypothetical protein
VTATVKLHGPTLRRAAEACERISKYWARQTKLAISGRGDGESDDWGEMSARAATAAQCARALRKMLAETD